MDNATVRAARDEELADVADLRWQWAVERQHAPATTREEFIRRFVQWARTNASSHQCIVAVRGSAIVGMAWLALLPRVPAVRAVERLSGDIQSVYVVPEERNAGLGSQIIDAVLRRAHELGLERVTVHSSDRAVPAYSRHGFTSSPVMLHVEVAPAR
jgi:GNAT superfamily N-acetyltransferase